MGAIKRFFKTLYIIDIASDDFCTRIRERFRLLGIGVSRYRARSKGTMLVVQNGADQPATLSTCGSDHRDDFLVGLRLSGLLMRLPGSFFLFGHGKPPLECCYQLPCSPITSIARTNRSAACRQLV